MELDEKTIRALAEEFAKVFTEHFGRQLWALVDRILEVYALNQEALRKVIAEALAARARATPSEERRGSRIAEIVRRSGVQLLSEMNIRSPSAFVEAAEKAGVVVLSGAKDVAFVDPELWEQFKEELPKLPREPEVEALNTKRRKLFEFLRDNALIVWSPEGRWELV